ncbi:MAG: hypothetical protein ISS91_02990 [Candidatus Omnitrophica bacterium]|nr:hypothetical protein [Candidatus Omnitrophota bacterium]
MRKIFGTIVIAACVLLTAFSIYAENPPHEAGPNSFSRSTDGFYYNEYEIEITSLPRGAKIEWNAKEIGTTPFLYKFTGTLKNGDYVIVRATPSDPDLDLKAQVFRGFRQLPKEIHFRLSSE